MAFEELDVRLGLKPGQIATAQMCKGPPYAKIVLHCWRARWKPHAEAKTRSVWSPCPELRVVQRGLQQLISARFQSHPIAHAYTKGRGIVTNAEQHVRKEWLLHTDIVNFFGAITERLVHKALRKLLSDFSGDDIAVLTHLSCHEGSLPQGSPSSPILSNLVCYPFDESLQELASSLELSPSRYSDDMCFSSRNAFVPDELATVRGRGAYQQIELGAQLRGLFDRCGFKVNGKKLRFQDRSDRQMVTGLVVNDRVTVPREYYQRVRDILHVWSRYGIHAAVCNYQPWWPVERFVGSLRGLIAYIGQVAGPSDKRYQTFLLTFEELTARDLAGHGSDASPDLCSD